MTEPLLQINNLSYTINGTTILHDLTFAVSQGEYLSIIGPNGAGKTTLLQLCNRIRRGGTGDIRLQGKLLMRYKQREVAQIISYVPQASGLQFPFTVYEFVLMGRYPYLHPLTAAGEKDRKVVDEALEMTGTEAIMNRTMNSLSGGEQQKALIAAALAQDTPLLLLDEPTTFLDPPHQAEIFSLLDRINREKKVTVISVMHDLNNAVLTSHTIMGIRAGEIQYIGPADGLTENGVLRRIYHKSFRFFNNPETGKKLVVPEGAL